MQRLYSGNLAMDKPEPEHEENKMKIELEDVIGVTNFNPTALKPS